MMKVKNNMSAQYARQLAHTIALFLQKKFGATRVLVFGSLVEEGGKFFDPHTSDIDIYFEGVPTNRTFQAIGACLAEFGEYDKSGRQRVDYKPEPLCNAAFKQAILPSAIAI